MENIGFVIVPLFYSIYMTSYDLSPFWTQIYVEYYLCSIKPHSVCQQPRARLTEGHLSDLDWGALGLEGE